MAVIVLAWIVLSLLVGAYASSKGRSGLAFLFLALFMTPLIAFLIAVLGRADPETVARKSGLKKCPRCAEYVQRDTLMCRYCKNMFPTEGGGS